MRNDNDLNFIKEIKSEQLNVLVEILTKNKNGEERITESLTLNERFKRYYPDHQQYWDLIVHELQRFGANTLASMFRLGDGVPYRVILINVCKKMKVNFNSDTSIEMIEMNLLMKILTDSMQKMTPKQLKEVVDSMNLKTSNYTLQAVTIALQTGVKMSGFVAYQTAVIVANAVAKQLFSQGLRFASNTALTRSISVFAGPVGWVLTGAWTAIDLAGPAYRVTIPSVIQVAFLRAQLKNQHNESNQNT